MKTLTLAIGLAIVALPHEYFISVLTMRHDPAKHTLDLTWQITAHDLEHAISNVADLKLNSAQEHTSADSLINAYFADHLHLVLKDQPLLWSWVGREMEGENLFCYMQVEGVLDPRGLHVSNTLLQDVFEEQDNIVHLEHGGQVHSQHFRYGDDGHTFE